MKVYIAGPMTNRFLFNRPKFYWEHLKLKIMGYKVMNPAILPFGFEHEEYMQICFKMIDCCDAVYLMDEWHRSNGATRDYNYAISKNKEIIDKY